MEEFYSELLKKWFITEPVMFQVLCLHQLVANSQMSCPMRSGQTRIEYNPLFTNEMSGDGVEELFRAEAVRLVMKHPYERRPHNCSLETIALSSNIVIGDNYFHSHLRIEKPEDFNLPTGKSYEFYATQLEFNNHNSDNQENSNLTSHDNSISNYISQRTESLRDIAALWEYDALMVLKTNEIISNAFATKCWGSITGKILEYLENSLKAKIDWSYVLNGFRASVISSKRKLTRMRPNRRTGFQNMGSIRRLATKILVAVDVSGSISNEALKYFYGVIDSAFRYGIESVDVIQFDVGVKTVITLKRALKNNIGVYGRGGTSFQEPINYAHENGYDGLVFLTDGCAPEPELPKGFKSKLIWVCTDEFGQQSWMTKHGRSCIMQIS